MKSKIALAQRMLAMLLCVLMLTGSVIPAFAQDGQGESGTENAQTLQQKPEPQQPEEKPDKPEEKPEKPEAKPEKPEEKLGKPEQKPDQPEQKPDQPEQKPDQPEQKPEEPEQKPDEPEQKPDQPEQKPDQPEQKPDQPEQKPDEPEQKPDQPEQKPDQPEQKPDQPEQKPEKPEQKPDQPEQKPDEPEQKPEEPEQKPDQPEQKPEQKPDQPEQKPDQPEQKLGNPEENTGAPMLDAELSQLGNIMFGSTSQVQLQMTVVPILECEHENKSILSTSYVLADGAKWEPDEDGTTHSAVCMVTVTYKCPDCGNKWDGEPEQKPSTLKHELVDGVCQTCLFEEKTCAHTNKSELFTSYQLIEDESWEPDEDGTTHSAVCMVTVTYKCPDCGNKWEGEPEQKPSTLKHEFVEGVCKTCLFEEKTCAHTNKSELFTSYQLIENESWEPDENGKTHSAVCMVTVTYKCQDCGNKWEGEPEQKPSTLEHDFVEGECTVCHVKLSDLCAHEEKTETGRTETKFPDSDWMDCGDGKNHKAWHEVTIHYTCAKCGADFDEPGESLYKKEAHNFENGVCTVCKEEYCAHENADVNDGWKLAQGQKWQDNGNGTHTALCEITKEYWCEDCSASWSETQKTEQLTKNHTFYDGECFYCGVKNACKHENVESDEGYKLKDGEKWTINEDGTHTGLCLVTTYYDCEDCGESWSDEPVEKSWTGRHLFWHGACEDCGLANPCEHKNCDSWESTSLKDGEKWTINEDGTHTGLCLVTVYHDCDDCDDNWKDAPTEKTITEKHSFEDGKCETCGAENACEHENTVVRPYERILSDAKWTDDKNGRTHSAPGIVVENHECKDCGEEWEKSTEIKVTVERDHDMISGVCEDCGAVKAACAHKNTVTASYYENIDGEDWKDNGLTHSRKEMLVKEKLCTDCYESLEDISREERIVTYRHDYENGECCSCGAKSACEHKNVSVWRGTQFAGKPTATSAMAHKGLAYVVEERMCADCDEMLSEKTIESAVEKYEEHNFADGVCTQCGYKSLCDHRKTTVRKSFTTYGEAILTSDETGHTILGSEVEYVTCKLCGYWISEKILKENVEKKEAHDFDPDGICGYCYYDGGAEAAGSACKHEKEPKVSEYYNCASDVKKDDSSTHSYLGRKTKVYRCADCNEFLRQEETDELKKVKEEHVFNSDKVCIYCEYKKKSSSSSGSSSSGSSSSGSSSSSSSSSSGSMQDYVNGYVQSVYSDSAWAQPIYSVSDVIVKKMETVSAEAARNGASVEIIGVKKLVDESVYEQMKALPIGEQMLVALTISGFGSEVQAAMTDMSVSYSQETALLIERILASLSMLTPEQLADRAEFIAQYFPRTKTYFSGVMRDYVTIDLLVEEDGIAYTERYGFCYDEYKGQWFFVKKTESDAPIM